MSAKVSPPAKTRMIDRLPQRLRNTLSFVLFTARRYFGDNMTLSAGALTFSTLLAMVPLMVIAFAILSGFSAFDPARARMEEMFFEIFVPEVGAGVGNYLTDFSRNAANLTAAGIVALAFTAVMLLWTIEATLNQIWRVEKPRSIQIRVLIYWTVLTMGPLLLGAGFVLTSGTFSTITQWARQGVGSADAVPTLGVFFAFLSQFLTFTLLFKIIPARHVRLQDAAIGGAISAFGVQVLRWGFDLFLSSGSTYETVYGAVAILPIFLFWLYLSWVVVIVGAVCAAALPEWGQLRRDRPTGPVTPAQRLQAAVRVLSVLATKAKDGATATPEDLQSAAPLEISDDLFDSLRATGFIVQTENDRIGLLRDLHLTTLGDLARELRLSLGASTETADDLAPSMIARGPFLSSLPAALQDLHAAEAEILSMPLHDLIFEESAAPRPADRKMQATAATPALARG